MKSTNISRYAYLAGLIDGEGCICINKTGRRISNDEIKVEDNKQALILRVIVTQKDGQVMDWLKGNFGGGVNLHYKGTNTGYLHEWTLSHEKAGEILKKILPFLVIKKRQAEIAIQFQNRVTHGKTIGTHEYIERYKLYEEIAKEKHIHTKAKCLKVAALTTK